MRQGPGRFNCPHAVYIAGRGGQRELYIADRTNGRVLVYDLDGTYLREIAAGQLHRPCVFAVTPDHLVIGELDARLVFVGSDDEIDFTVGDNRQVCEDPGWPNALDDAGQHVRPDRLEPGKCNSPHGLAVDPHGHIYVAEWLIGGRLVRLVPQ